MLNGGAVNGVACYWVTSTGLVPDGVGLRSFGFNATTPPVLGGPSGSGSDIQFSIDSEQLITTFKGTATGAGHVSVFDVSSSGDVSPTWTDNSLMGAPFGFALGSDPSELFVTNVAFGGENLISLSSTNELSVLSTVNNTADFVASCWSIYSSTTSSYYVLAAASPYYGTVDSAGALVQTVSIPSALGGLFDTVVNGATAYALTATNNLAVIDLETNEVTQQLTYATAEERPFWTGMAIWPNSNPLLNGAS